MTRTVYRFRLTAVCLGLVALVFLQEPGRVAADSKLDLTVNPLGFLSRALHMWDSSGFFGQVQNQAYGYLWPVGPFFAALREAGVVAWVVQRTWWSMILIVGFLGFVLLARHLGVRSAMGRVIGGLGYVLSIRMTTELTTVSVELWPMAVAPWILIPLVIGSQRGSPRRWAAASGVAFLMTGAINAVASVAVLTLAGLYLATRTWGSRTRALAGWWTLSIALASLWWLVPLLLLGRYSPPFLDWIESASVTTGQNDPTNVLRGASQWVPYIVDQVGPVWPGGWALVTSSWAILASALVVLAGVAGLLSRRVPERSFLVAALALGLVLTGLAHQGPSGIGALGADQLRTLLDGPLSPLRNVHKFQPVVTLPLMMGLAHFVELTGERAASLSSARRGWLRVAALTGAAAALVVSAAPLFTGQVVGGRSFSEIPDYWAQTTRWLDDRATGRALVVPGASFAVFAWGRTQDEPLQALGADSWAVRDAVPLSSAGNIRFLDEVERHLQTGTASDALASSLARAGIRWIVLRNDLDSRATGAPMSVLVHQALDGSPGIERAATFGPILNTFEGGGTVVDGGVRRTYPAVEVFAVAPDPQGTLGRVTVRAADEVVQFTGSTESLIDLGDSGLLGDSPAFAVGDPMPTDAVVRHIVTDTYRRAEANFGAMRDQYSQTLTAQDTLRAERAVPDYFPVPPDGLLSEARLVGAEALSASSSGSSPFALRSRSQAAQPWAAMDGDDRTSWVSGQYQPGVGQWWQVDFEAPRSVPWVDLGFLRDYRVGAPPEKVRITTDAGSLDVVVDPRATSQRVAAPAGSTGSLRVELTAVEGGGPGFGFGLTEVRMPEVEVDRPIQLPQASASAGLVLSARSMGRESCAAADTAVICDPDLAAPGEERAGIDRLVDLSEGGSFTVQARLRPRPGSALDAYLVAPETAVRVQASSQVTSDPAVRAQAAADRQSRTTWVAAPLDPTPTLTLTLPEVQQVDGLILQTSQDAPASRPLEVTVTANGLSQTLFTDPEGGLDLPSVRTDELILEFGAVNPVRSVESATSASTLLPVGVTEVIVTGSPDRRMTAQPADAVQVPCGFGPVVTVDGASAALTEVSTTVGDIVDGSLAQAQGCDESVVHLSPGVHRIEVSPTAEWLVEDVVLNPVGVAPAAASPQAARISQWTDTVRVLEVAPDDRPRLVETTENFNAGWRAEIDGVALEPYRVDGWRQAYLVPAGVHGEVVLTYSPDSVYRVGLLVGLVAALALVVCALLPAQSRVVAGASGPAALARVTVGAPVVASVLFGGWIGAAGAAGAFLVLRAARARSAPTTAFWVSGYGLLGLTVALGLQVAFPWPARLDMGGVYDVLTVIGPAMALGSLAAVGLRTGARAPGSAVPGSAN